jgi:hypothetical protein
MWKQESSCVKPLQNSLWPWSRRLRATSQRHQTLWYHAAARGRCQALYDHGHQRAMPSQQCPEHSGSYASRRQAGGVAARIAGELLVDAEDASRGAARTHDESDASLGAARRDDESDVALRTCSVVKCCRLSRRIEAQCKSSAKHESLPEVAEFSFTASILPSGLMRVQRRPNLSYLACCILLFGTLAVLV